MTDVDRARFRNFYRRPDRFITQLDPSLRLRDRLRSVSSSTAVYLVHMGDGQHGTLKVAHFGHNLARKHLEREKLVLERLQNVPGITHLVDVFLRPNLIALLKEYVEGDRITSFSQIDYSYLANTLRRLHSSGVAYLDLFPVNVIREKESKKPVMVDLGSAWFSYETSEDGFEILKNQDYQL